MELVIGSSIEQASQQVLAAGKAWAMHAETTKPITRLEAFRMTLSTGTQTATGLRFGLFTTIAGAEGTFPLANPLFEGETKEKLKATEKPEIVFPYPIELIQKRDYFMVIMPVGGEIHFFKKAGGEIAPAVLSNKAGWSLLTEIPEVGGWEALAKQGLSRFEGLGSVPVGTLREKQVASTPPGQLQILATLTAEASSSATTISASVPAPTSYQGNQFHAIIGTLNSKGEIEGGEYVLVTKATTTTWTVERGKDKSSEVSHASGQGIYHLLTPEALENIAVSPGGAPIDIANCKGVDKTGATDSSIGIMEARLQAISEKRVLKASSGKYKVEGLVELGSVGMRGDGSGNTVFFKNSTDGKMFTVSNGPSNIRDFSIENENHEATVGSFFIVETQNLGLAENVFSNEVKIENVTVHQPYNAFEVRNTGGTYFRQVVAENVVNSAFWTHGGALEQLLNTFVFAANEKITFEGKSKATLIKLESENSGSVFENGEILLGKSGMSASVVNNVGTGRSNFIVFSNCFFDSGREPISLTGATRCKFVNTWFSVRPNGGVLLKECEDISFLGCEMASNGTYGIFIDKASVYIRLSSCHLTAEESTNASVEVEGAGRFLVESCTFGTVAAGSPGVLIKAPASAWKASTEYKLGELVTNKGQVFKCIKAMTPGEDVEPPEATHWSLTTYGDYYNVSNNIFAEGRTMVKDEMKGAHAIVEKNIGGV